MKKFVIAAITAAALSTTVSAEGCASSFSGFYAGLQAGMNATAGDVKTAGTGVDTSRTASAQSFIGGLFAGYGMGVGSCAYVGGELYVNFTNNDVNLYKNNRANGEKNTGKNTYNYGAKVRLGYTVSQQAMIFLGLGIEQSRWQFKQTPTNPTAANPEKKKNKMSTEFAPSVGMEMFMTKNIFVRGEYTCVFGPRVKFEGNDQPFAGNNVTSKFNANQHRFALGLGYKF